MNLLRNSWKNRWLVVMSLPALILFIMFSYIPMFGLVLAFKKFDYSKGIFGSPWCGLNNFRLLFISGQTFWRLTRNTVGYYLLFTVTGTIGNVFLAIGINEFACKKLGKFFQSCMILPTFITYIAVTFIVYACLRTDGGLVNRLVGKNINWYLKAEAWPVILLIVRTWKSVGYGSVLYLSVLAGIDTQLYEAAALDGANARQRMWHITLPMLMPMVAIMTLLGLGSIMNSDTGLFYQVTKNIGALYRTTQVLDSYVLNAIMSSTDFSLTSAITFYQSVVGCIMVVGTNAIVRKVSPENALF